MGCQPVVYKEKGRGTPGVAALAGEKRYYFITFTALVVPSV